MKGFQEGPVLGRTQESKMEPGHQPGMTEGDMTLQGAREQACRGTSPYSHQHFFHSVARDANPTVSASVAAGPCASACWPQAFLGGEGKCPHHVRQTGDGQKGCLARGGLGIPHQLTEVASCSHINRALAQAGVINTKDSIALYNLPVLYGDSR